MLSTTVLHTELNPAEIERGRQCAENRLAPNTHQAIGSDAKALQAFCGSRFPHVKDVRQCTAEHVWAFMTAQEQEGLAMSTIQRRFTSLKAHTVVGITEEQWATLEGLLTGMRRFAAGQQTAATGKDALLWEHIERMLATCTTEGRVDVRDRAFLLFGWNTGMRRSELAALRWADLSFQPKGVLVRICKSKTDQLGAGATIGVHVKPEASRCAVAALLKWREHPTNRPASPFVFPGRYGEQIDHSVLWKLVNRRCTLAGLDASKYGAHSLRSGMITQGALNGVPVNELRLAARHHSVDTTSRYMKQTELLGDHSITTRL